MPGGMRKSTTEELLALGAHLEDDEEGGAGNFIRALLRTCANSDESADARSRWQVSPIILINSPEQF